jgi:hypothetical protein
MIIVMLGRIDLHAGPTCGAASTMLRHARALPDPMNGT